MLDGVYDIGKSELEQMYGDSVQLTKLIQDLQSLRDVEGWAVKYNMSSLNLPLADFIGLMLP